MREFDMAKYLEHLIIIERPVTKVVYKLTPESINLFLLI